MPDATTPGLKMYEDVKHLENQIKNFPQKHATVHMGYYDAKTKAFHGYYTPEDLDLGGSEGRGPVTKPHVKHFNPVSIPVDAVTITLTFAVRNYTGGGFTVTANGKSAHTQNSWDTIGIDVGAAVSLEWELTLDKGGEISSVGTIVRPSVGAGAFKIEAMPITIVYAPPQDAQNRNTAAYTATKSLGNTAIISMTDETATTKPETDYVYGGDIKSEAEAAGKSIGSIDTPYTKAIGAILSIFGAAMDSVDTHLTNGRKAENENGMTLSVTAAQTFPSGSGGPGAGDIIAFLKGVRLAWLVSQPPHAKQSTVKLTMLAYDSEALIKVADLQDDLKKIAASASPKTSTGPISGLTAATIQALLALDPFASGGPNAPLNAPRFQAGAGLPAQIDLDSDVPFQESLTASAADYNSNASTTYTVLTQDYSPGFWTSLGIGGNTGDFEKKTVVSSSSLTSLGKSTKDTSTTTQVNLFGPAHVQVFYDTVFGTFAFRSVAAGAPRVSGILKDASGKAVANQTVALEIGGRRYLSATDGNGRYAFHSPEIPKGQGTLVAGNLRQVAQTAGN